MSVSMKEITHCDYDCNLKSEKSKKPDKLLGLKLNSKQLLCKTYNSRMNSIETRAVKYNLKGRKVKCKCANVRKRACTGLC